MSDGDGSGNGPGKPLSGGLPAGLPGNGAAFSPLATSVGAGDQPAPSQGGASSATSVAAAGAGSSEAGAPVASPSAGAHVPAPLASAAGGASVGGGSDGAAPVQSAPGIMSAAPSLTAAAPPSPPSAFDDSLPLFIPKVAGRRHLTAENGKFNAIAGLVGLYHGLGPDRDRFKELFSGNESVPSELRTLLGEYLSSDLCAAMASAFDSAPMMSSLAAERSKFQSILLPLKHGASFAEMLTQCVVGPVVAKERMAVFHQLEAVVAGRFPAFAVSRDRTALDEYLVSHVLGVPIVTLHTQVVQKANGKRAATQPTTSTGSDLFHRGATMVGQSTPINGPSLSVVQAGEKEGAFHRLINVTAGISSNGGVKTAKLTAAHVAHAISVCVRGFIGRADDAGALPTFEQLLPVVSAECEAHVKGTLPFFAKRFSPTAAGVGGQAQTRGSAAAGRAPAWTTFRAAPAAANQPAAPPSRGNPSVPPQQGATPSAPSVSGAAAEVPLPIAAPTFSSVSALLVNHMVSTVEIAKRGISFDVECHKNGAVVTSLGGHTMEESISAYSAMFPATQRLSLACNEIVVAVDNKVKAVFLPPGVSMAAHIASTTGSAATPPAVDSSAPQVPAPAAPPSGTAPGVGERVRWSYPKNDQLAFIASLAGMSPVQRRSLIGNRIYPIVQLKLSRTDTTVPLYKLGPMVKWPGAYVRQVVGMLLEHFDGDGVVDELVQLTGDGSADALDSAIFDAMEIIVSDEAVGDAAPGVVAASPAAGSGAPQVPTDTGSALKAASARLFDVGAFSAASAQGRERAAREAALIAKTPSYVTVALVNNGQLLRHDATVTARHVKVRAQTSDATIMEVCRLGQAEWNGNVRRHSTSDWEVIETQRLGKPSFSDKIFHETVACMRQLGRGGILSLHRDELFWEQPGSANDFMADFAEKYCHRTTYPSQASLARGGGRAGGRGRGGQHGHGWRPAGGDDRREEDEDEAGGALASGAGVSADGSDSAAFSSASSAGAGGSMLVITSAGVEESKESDESATNASAAAIMLPLSADASGAPLGSPGAGLAGIPPASASEAGGGALESAAETFVTPHRVHASDEASAFTDLSPAPGLRVLTPSQLTVTAVSIPGSSSSLSSKGIATATIMARLGMPALRRVLADAGRPPISEYHIEKYNDVVSHLANLDGGEPEAATAGAVHLLEAIGCKAETDQGVASEQTGATASHFRGRLDVLLPPRHGLVLENAITIEFSGGSTRKFSLDEMIIEVPQGERTQQLIAHVAKQVARTLPNDATPWRLSGLPQSFSIYFKAPTDKVIFPDGLLQTLYDMRDLCSEVGKVRPVPSTGAAQYRVVSASFVKNGGGDACSCVYVPLGDAKQCYVIRDRRGKEARRVDCDTAAVELEAAKVFAVSFALAHPNPQTHL